MRARYTSSTQAATSLCNSPTMAIVLAPATSDGPGPTFCFLRGAILTTPTNSRKNLHHCGDASIISQKLQLWHQVSWQGKVGSKLNVFHLSLFKFPNAILCYLELCSPATHPSCASRLPQGNGSQEAREEQWSGEPEANGQ